ncbi:DUF4382 domain-containing protein [Marinobacter sp. bablab_jr008]|uniref:DUF4382 domain-containing protein n=1 Tax=Marinobacter sp. bablab_jr008 TaxID=2755064 RepID=UPI0018F14A80|nr:DUF4382 domain-containing protein [Marinobacter sp. bablab_jr008]MEC9386875.1 DUF4382 domain-containing protein [Pseudomonadota bacterium]
MKQMSRVFVVSALASALVACGGSGGSSSSGETGSVSVGLTDAPTMELSSVNIAFNAIRLKPADGDWLGFNLDETGVVDLLTLQGGVTEPLITNEEVPAGVYNEIRLIIDTDNSYVTKESNGDSQFTLAVPSGEQSGLKLKGDFVVAADSSNNFTIDFDVRKSIVDPQGQALADYMLKPVLRLVDNLEVGAIEGTVDYATIAQTRGTDDVEDTLADCEYDGAVYVYEGTDVEPIDLNVTRDGTNPLMVVPVTAQESGSLYEWTAAFLTEGQYTIAYSCQLDNNETDETLEFDGQQNVSVVAGETTVADPIPQP